MTTSYALRHRTTGRFVRIRAVFNDDADYCNSHTCSFDTTSEDLPRFEVDTLRDLMAAMRFDPEWYASSPDRPMHDGVCMEDCVPYRLEIDEIYDETGGDPVSISMSTHRVDLPPLWSRKPKTVNQPDKSIFITAFGEQAWNDIVGKYMEIVTADADGAEALVPGMLVITDRNNMLQATYVVEHPDAPAGRMLIACSTGDIVEKPDCAFEPAEEPESSGFSI